MKGLFLVILAVILAIFTFLKFFFYCTNFGF